MEFEKKEEQKLDLFIILDNFLKEAKRFWIIAIVLMALFAGGLAGRQYLSYTPIYTATASFTVKVANPLYSSISAYNVATAEQMAKTFPYILTSGVLQERVTNYLDIPYMPHVDVTASSGSSVLTMSVTDTDPQQAYDVLNAVMTYYPEIAEFVVGSTVLVLLDESGVPTQPANPLNLVGSVKQGALIGAAIWVFLMAILAALKNTVHNEDELKRLLNIPCLGQVPLVKIRQQNTYPLIHKLKKHTGFSESIRLLRMHAEKRMNELEGKVLLISSAIPGEGKTTVSVNLAVSLALSGKKILLIDCDLRSPSVNKTLGIKSAHSLTEFLRGKASIRDVLCATDVENLMVISSNNGNANDLDLLSEGRTAQLIQGSRKFFDYIILDTPPCSLLADASELSVLADCGLMVIRQDYASRDQILDGIQRLGDCQLPMLGCALNCMNKGFSSGYEYGYGYGYNSGYGYGYGYGQKGKNNEQSSH